MGKKQLNKKIVKKENSDAKKPEKKPQNASIRK